MNFYIKNVLLHIYVRPTLSPYSRFLALRVLVPFEVRLFNLMRKIVTCKEYSFDRLTWANRLGWCSNKMEHLSMPRSPIHPPHPLDHFHRIISFNEIFDSKTETIQAEILKLKIPLALCAPGSLFCGETAENLIESFQLCEESSAVYFT